MSSAIFFIFRHFQIDQTIRISPGLYETCSPSQAIYLATIDCHSLRYYKITFYKRYFHISPKSSLRSLGDSNTWNEVFYGFLKNVSYVWNRYEFSIGKLNWILKFSTRVKLIYQVKMWKKLKNFKDVKIFRAIRLNFKLEIAKILENHGFILKIFYH